MTRKSRERCSACDLLGKKHQVRKKYPFNTRYTGNDLYFTQWVYECDNGHEWRGTHEFLERGNINS